MTAGEGGRSIWKDLPFIIAAALGFSVAGVHFYSFGLFMQPLEQEFGWNRSEVSAALMIISTVGVIAAPFVGIMIDRWGARRVGLPGIVVYMATFAALALVGASIWTFWGLFLILALSISTITATVWTAAVAARFGVGKRGLAIALVLCGASLTMLVAPLAAEWLISHHGWRAAYLGLAALYAVVTIPMVALFFRNDRPAPSEAVAAETPAHAPPGIEVSLKDALRSWRYWSIVTASLIASIGALSLTTHLVPLVTDAGISRTVAAAAAGMIGIASASGRLLEGYLLDRFKGPAIGAVSLMLPMAACILILFVEPSGSWAVTLALVLGAAVGAEVNILAYITSRYFGVRHYGVLFGIVYAMVVVGGGLGPLLGGVIYDLTGDYHYLAWTVMPMCLVCAMLILILGPYPEQREAAGQ